MIRAGDYGVVLLPADPQAYGDIINLQRILPIPVIGVLPRCY